MELGTYALPWFHRVALIRAAFAREWLILKSKGCSADPVAAAVSAAASIARRVYMRQNLGVGALRIHYGGRNKRKGVVPEHFAKASGGLIRHIFKQLGE